MADPAELLASTEESLKKVAAEIERLGQSAETAWQAYRGAERGQKSAAKEYWQAAVREKEAARRKEEALLAERLAERKAVIERLPTAGQLSTGGKQQPALPINLQFPTSQRHTQASLQEPLYQIGLPHRSSCLA